MSDSPANHEQATFWNEQGGPRWVAMQQQLDAELAPFGEAVLKRLALESGARVLDVGCGAGATSLMLAERVRPGEVVGTDISVPLLERARQRAAGVANLRFQHADAQTFDFGAASFDAVFSRFGVMFFADPVAAFDNLRRALRPSGRLGFVCWRPLRENPSFSVPIEAARPVLTDLPAAPADPHAPGPFALADAARTRTLLERAGYADVDLAPLDVQMQYGGRKDLDGAVEVAMQVGPLARALVKATDETRTRARAAVREAFARLHGPEGVMFAGATWRVTARRA